MDRREMLKTLGLGMAAAAMPRSLKAAEGAPLAPARRPNVVFIYTDDQPLSQVACYGGKVLSPHTDSLARDGMLFTRFHVSSPVCSPSRFSTLTGRYASRSKSQQRKFPPGGPVNIGWEAGICGEEHTLAHVMQRAGYRTGMVGKWMQGLLGPVKQIAVDAQPTDPGVAETLERNYDLVVRSIKSCGFDYVGAAYLQNVGERGQAGARPGWLPMSMRWHNQEWVTQAALDFLSESRDQPFFLYMPTTLNHGPSAAESMRQDPRLTPVGLLEKAPDCQPSRASVFERVKAAGVPQRLAGVTWLDDAVGAVLGRIEELGLADNTIVVFASDNGARGKFSCYDAGARMPFLVRWPGRVQAGSRCEKLASNLDLAPTIFELGGVTPPEELTMDGRSILAAFKGEGTYERDSLMLEITTERAVVTDDYLKYIAVRYPPEVQAKVDQGERYSHWCVKVDENLHHSYNAEKHYPAYFDQDQLYDLRADPDEQRNLAGDPAYGERLREMQALLREYSRGLPHTYGEFKTG